MVHHGVSIYVIKDIQYELIKDLTFNIKDYLETLTIEIKLKKNKKIIISCLYNSPFNKTADLINMLYSKFHKYIAHDLIIMGDFNIIK